MKRKSNNPLGRKPVEDKRVLVGIYIPSSVIKKRGGKSGDISKGKHSIREILLDAVSKL